mmetsp:Transcript_27789/g.49294  ORF Transcript_27789/g.49294 Transcript_27789/m.49294 type:complete len:104 (+) Transcript_27789:232-543(+)
MQDHVPGYSHRQRLHRTPPLIQRVAWASAAVQNQVVFFGWVPCPTVFPSFASESQIIVGPPPTLYHLPRYQAVSKRSHSFLAFWVSTSNAKVLLWQKPAACSQ